MILLKRRLQLRPQFVVELMQHLRPGLHALRDLVEFLLDFPRVADFDELVFKAFLEEAGHRLAQRRGIEPSLPLLHIAAVFDDVDDAGVGRGAADALLLQLLHQRGLGVSRGG